MLKWIKKIREEQQIMSQAMVELESAENLIKNHAEYLDIKMVEKAKKIMETLRMAMDSKKFDEIKKITEELRNLNFSLGTELYHVMEKHISEQKEKAETSSQQVATKTKEASIIEQIKKVTDEDILSWFKKKKEN
ncbi:MAG: hypothetical protein ACK4GJ_06675 [bacterium]